MSRGAAPAPLRPSEPPPNPGADHIDLEGAPLDEIRFRLKRHSATELQNLTLHFVFFDAAGRLVRAEVIDFSENGLGISLPAGQSRPSGEVLSDVEVHAGERCVFKGRASVVSQPSRPRRLGISLFGDRIDVDVLMQEDARAGRLAECEEHLDALREQLQPDLIPVAYRATVADMVSLLTALERHFGEVEGAAEGAELLSDDLQRIEDLVAPDFVRLSNRLGESIAGASPIAVAAAAAYAKRLLHPLLLCGTIPRRAYEKPLGYAGDYQLMHLVYRQKDRAPSAYERLVNRLCCATRAAQAAVTRIDLLTRFIQDEVESRAGRPVRIGSMACGPAEEAVRLVTGAFSPDTPVELALIDQDRDALTFCSRRMLRLEAKGLMSPDVRVGFFHMSVKTIITNPAEIDAMLGRFDIAYTVGLFDYLAGPAARAMVDGLLRFVAPGGVLLIGNFTYHEGQAFMEHVLDWRLRYRDESELLRLVDDALGDRRNEFDIEVISEPHRAHLFVTLRRR